MNEHPLQVQPPVHDEAWGWENESTTAASQFGNHG
jgi:hypothetical protein